MKTGTNISDAPAVSPDDELETLRAGRTLVAVVSGVDPKQMDAWVRKVALESCQPVDCVRLTNGNACILTGGDSRRVATAVIALKRLLPEGYRFHHSVGKN